MAQQASFIDSLKLKLKPMAAKFYEGQELIPPEYARLRFYFLSMDFISTEIISCMKGTLSMSVADASGTPLATTYEPDFIPADWKLAELHGKATWPGKHIQGKTQACPCCMRYIQKEPAGYCQSTKELAFLGEGFPLFYNFLRYCIIMLVALILDDAIIAVMLNFHENHCTKLYSPAARQLSSSGSAELVNCEANMANQYAYISDVEDAARTAIKITGFIAQACILLYFRDQQNKMAAHIDERNCTMSDYTMLIENLPTGQDNNREKITRLICDGQPQLQVMDVLLIDKEQDYTAADTQLKQITGELQHAIKKEAPEQTIAELRARYNRHKEYLRGLCNSIKQNERKYFHGMAFVVMNTEEQKEKAIQMINGLDDKRVLQQYPSYSPKIRISAAEAGEPKEIIWENIHATDSQRYLSIFLGWLLTVVIMVGITIGFFYLIKFKGHLIQEAHAHYTEDPKYELEFKQGVALGYIIVIMINLINKFIFSALFFRITHSEKHLSVSSFNYSYALKSTLGMFFTTAVMTLLVEAIIYGNYTGALGVIQEENSMLIFNAYFGPLVWLLNLEGAVAWIKRKIYYGNSYFTQQQANELMERPKYNMGKRYAEVIKTIWFTFLYVELIPFGAVYSLTGLILYYFVDKHVLLHLSSTKESVSSKLSRTMVTILDFTLVLKPAGELIFDSHLRNYLSKSSLVMLCVGVVYILLPLNKILEWVNPENFEPESKTFEQIKDQFPETYFTLYPIQRKDVASKYFKKSTIEFVSQSRSPLKRTSTNQINYTTEELADSTFLNLQLAPKHKGRNAVHNELPPIKMPSPKKSLQST